MTTKLTSKVTAVVAAGMLVLSGTSALAAPARGMDGARYIAGDTEGTVTSDARGMKGGRSAEAREMANKKCKKKNKKKCKKKKPVEVVEEEGFVPGRVVELTYMGPAIGGADTPAANPFGLVAPVNFIAGPGETQAMIEIIDDASPNASAGFAWDSDGDGLNDQGIDVCGSTPEPVEMIEGTQYNVFPYLLPSTSCTDGVATSGTIIVTFNKV